MAVVAAAVADGQGVGVGAEGDGGNTPPPFGHLPLRRGGVFCHPDGDDAVAADVGVDLVGVEALQVADNHIVSKLLAAGGLRVLVELMAYFLVINHSFIICSRKKSPRCSKFLKAS